MKFASSKVKNGEYDIDIEQIEDKDIYSIACDIAAISESIDDVVSNKVHDEKEKMKLVLNASHDLTNPLESIIETATLIEENVDNKPVLKKHLETLKRRVERLQTLSDEIKTGNKKGKIEKELVNVKEVDVFSFLTKGLSEIEQEMKKSNLSIKLNLAKSKIKVEADENLLWRAFENLIKDVFKHAKKGTNVFIKIAEKDGCGLISIINEINEEDLDKMKISNEEFEKEYLSDPLNKTSLNIAKELVEKQGGALKVRINNNTFEAIIMLKECE
ncbi:MAG: HAMP domain-containing histidine kinase [Clostridia bacterium]|nr:HAMP domain-containing histidine kinase [Clostridia bacterium]